MAVKKESIQQTQQGTWAASTAVTIQLDRIGLVTRYETVVELTPSATAIGANQPDSFWRPFSNVQFLAGGLTYFMLPQDAGGEGAVILHYLNKLDHFGEGFVYQLIVAPSQTFYVPRLTFHAGVRPWRRDGTQNLFDLTGFVPAGIESSPQITWNTTPNSVLDDTITISSAQMTVTAHRVLGTTADIQAEMAQQGVADLIAAVQQGNEGILANQLCTGFIPSWYGQIESPTATAANYGSQLDMQLGGFITRVTALAQDATATRPIRGDDEVTQLNLTIPEKGVTIYQYNSELMDGKLPIGDFLVADDAATVLGWSPAPGAIYPVDLRPYGQTTIEQILGLDTRGRQSGYAKLGRTIATNASGDDILTLTERLLTYQGRLSNS